MSSAGTASVVTNNGTLTVKDSNKTVTHYYKVNADGLWVLDTTAASGTAYEDLKERPKENDVIAIKGGSITGGTKGTIIYGDKFGFKYNITVGGGIYSKGDITIDGATICGNTLDNTSGGAYMGIGVFNAGENCTLKNGAIICGNSCAASSYNPRGGAIFSASTIKADNSSLSFNTVLFTGGAIMIRGKYDVTGYYASITMKNCSLLGNSAYSGGAVYLLGDEDNPENTVFTFYNCTLDNNISEADGGAIDITYGKLNITGGSISNNTCVFDGVYAGSGAAIKAEADTTLKDVIISGNNAARGGAVWLNQYSLKAENVTFTKNKATGLEDASNGGAIYVRSDSELGSITLINCEVSENAADVNGGGICLMNKSTAEITGGKISNNTSGKIGGGLYVDAVLATNGNHSIGKATLMNVEVSGNKALSGGGIGMSASAQLLMNGCTVKGNSATETEVENTGLGGGIYKPGTHQTTADVIEEKIVLLNTEITGNTASVNGGGVYFKLTEYENSCFVKGTKISMADGTTKNVEDIVEGDVIKTFDHETGKISSSKVYLAWQKENTKESASFKLNFEGGNSVQCIGGHDFLEKASRKYQKLTADNAESYVGKSFYGEDGQWHKLLSVSIEKAPDNLYCIYSAKHQNAFAEGMLSVPDDVDYLLNIYELDENLKADEAQLAADIKEYGLTSYKYAKEHSDSITREWYEAVGTKYLFVAIGKGLFTEDQAIDLYNTTVEPSSEAKSSPLEGLKSALQPVLSFLAPAKVYAAETPTLDDYEKGVITVGSGTTITDNKVGDKQNNAYIVRSRKKPGSYGDWQTVESLFKVIADSTNINIGVTTSETPTKEASVPVTTAENSKDYSDFFTSDLSYNIYSTGSSPTEQVIIGNDVARIVETDISYGSVQAAIDAAQSGQTVKMLTDSKERILINSKTTADKVTLDLNGHALIGPNKDTAGIDNNVIMFNKSSAELTIKDSNSNRAHYYTYSSSSAWTLNDAASEDAKKHAITLDKVDSKTSDGTLILIFGGVITGGNRSKNSGGIYVAGKSTLTLNSINIIGNTANSGNSGGGVYGSSNSTINCSNCNIVGNIAIGTTSDEKAVGGVGGGIYTKGAVEITDSKIEYNQASFDGGALYVYGTKATATNTQFVGNNSARHGGAVYVAKGKTFNANKCTFSNNKATGAYGYGGALYINSESANISEVTIADCTFENNNAFASGGGIYNNCGTVNIKDGSYNNNSAEYAGVMFNDNGTATIEGGSYKNNSVARAGGVIYNDGAKLTITDSTFESNTALNDKNDASGGFLYNLPKASNSSVTITDAIIKNNKSNFGGGIVNAFHNNTSEITINNCEITSNSATGGGGGIHNMGTKLEIIGGSITSCTANNGGGILNNTDSNATLIIQDCAVTGNTAKANGGGVYNECSMTVSGTTKITGNKKGAGDTATDNNVYLPSGKTITVGTSELDTEAAIGVTLGTIDGTGAVTGANSADYHEYFIADNKDLVSYNDKISDTSQVVKLKVDHTHSWEYTLSKTTSDNDTVTAKCKGDGDCNYKGTDLSLTIKKPSSLEYDGTNKEAALSATSFIGSTTLPTISYEYKASEDGTYATAANKKDAGFYRASFAVGEGDGKKTAYVEYEVTKKQLSISDVTVNDKTYDGTIVATTTSGKTSGIIKGDDVTVSSSAYFNNRYAGEKKNVTINYSISGKSKANYIAPADDFSLTANIDKLQLTMSKDPVAENKTYDGNNTASVSIGSLFNVIEGDAVTVKTTSSTFADKNVGTGKTVTVVYAISGDDHKNYIVPVNGTTTANITAKTINVSADDKETFVGSDLDNLTYKADTLIEGDSFTGSLSTDADKSTAGTYDILQDTLTAGTNYSINYTKGIYTVKEKTVQTISFNGVIEGKVSKKYGDSKFTETVSGAQTTVTYSSSDPTVATVDPSTGEVTIVKAGKTTITATAEETTSIAEATAEYELTVNKIKVDVPEAQTGLIYNGTEQTGVILPENALYSLSNNKATKADTYSATAILSDKVSYEWNIETPSSQDQKIEWKINKKGLSISTESGKKTTVANKVYNGTDEATATIGTVLGIVLNDDVAVSVKRATFDNKHVGTDKDVTVAYELSGSKAENYDTPSNDTIKANITVKTVNVKADDKSSYVGSPIETLTCTKDDLCEGDTYTGTITTSADKDVVDTYDILQGTLGIDDGNSENNYSISFTKGTYTVSAKEIQTLTFEGVTEGKVTKTYGDAAFTEAVSGAETTVTYTSSEPKVATVNSETGEVTILKAGTTTITATAEETAVYEGASKNYLLTVNKIQVEVPTAKTDLVYNKTQQTGVELPENAVYTLSDNTGKSAKVYTAVATLTNKDNYEWKLKTPSSEDQNIQWSISPKSINVKADDKNSYKDADLETLTYAADELFSGDAFTGNITTDANNKKAGTYDITQGTLSAGSDYSINFTKGVYTVMKIKVTVPDAKTGLIYNRTEQTGVVLPENAVYTLKDNQATNAGSYNTIAELTDKDNYEWDLVTPTTANQTISWEIAKKEINVKADDKDSYIGSELVELTHTSDKLIEGDNYTGKLTTSANKELTGKSDILQGTLTAGNNYNITFTKGTYTVKPLEKQTLVFEGITGGTLNKTYGDAAFTEAVSGASTTVTYSSSEPSIATVDVSTGKVTILKAGTATITAKAAKTAVYEESSVEYTLNIQKALIEIPKAVSGLIYNGKEQTGVKLPQDAKYTISDNTATDAGLFTATVSLIDKTNYAWESTTPTDKDQKIEWNISRKQVTVTAEDKTMILGKKIPEFTAKVNGLLGTDEVEYSFIEINPSVQGVYSIVPDGDTEQGNYKIDYVQGTLTVINNESNAYADPEALHNILNTYRKNKEYKDAILDVELRTGAKVSEKDQELIKQRISSGKKASYINAQLYLIVKDGMTKTEENIGDDNDTLVAVTYQFDFTSKTDFQIMRVHETKDRKSYVDELKETPNVDGEYIVYSKSAGMVTIVAKKYSTFAITYNDIVTPKTGDSSNVWMYGIIAMIALFATVGGIIVLKHKKRHNN